MSGNKQNQQKQQANGITVKHGVSAVNAQGTPMQRAIGIGLDLLIGTAAAFAAAWLGDKVDAHFQAKADAAPKPAPSDISRQQFEHMVGMSVRDVEAQGRRDVKKVLNSYLKHNPNHKSWEPLEDEIRDILARVEKGENVMVDPDPLCS